MNIKTLLANKHTSGAALVYVGSIVAMEIGAVWFPNHAEQFKSTGKIIESAALTYGLLAAGDANPTPPNP